MKKLTILIILTVLFAFGCQEESSILDPTNNIASGDLSKGRPILNSDLKVLADETNPLMKYSKSFSINGKRGGELFVYHSWTNDQGNKVELYAELNIPKDAFYGTLDFDIIFDLENYSVLLSPTPFYFDKPLNFTMYFTGVDLSSFIDSSPVFDYLDDTSEDLYYGPTYIDIEKGIIKVWDVQITHFSRYGWTRTKTEK